MKIILYIAKEVRKINSFRLVKHLGSLKLKHLGSLKLKKKKKHVGIAAPQSPSKKTF